MPTLLVFHEVDDVDHWLSSPKRDEVFGPVGIKIRTFTDPAGSNRVGLIAEIPDMARLRADHAVGGRRRGDEVRRRAAGDVVESGGTVGGRRTGRLEWLGSR